MTAHDLLSTTALARELNLSSHELFSKFTQEKLIEREDKHWILTELGEKMGGQYVESDKYGRYIVWPASMATAPSSEQHESHFTATALGDKYALSANKINHILSELGWLKKHLKGWKVTVQGIKQGAIQDESQKTGIPFARWSEFIIANRAFLNAVQEVKGEKELSAKKKAEFHEQFKVEYRAIDGHFLRSKAEMMIDNWLYMAEITHACERKLPIEEDLSCDFYIPSGKVYIEYWGYEDNPKYLKQKHDKITIYKKYNFNLIELNEFDVQSLDDILPRLLLKFDVQSY